MATGPLEIRLLGDFEIRVGERVIPNDAWKLRKAAGIVKLLALEPTHRLHREQILDTLWPDLDPDAATNNLRVALHTVRRILSAGGIPLREGQHLVLGTNDSIWVDALTFEAALDRAWRDSDLIAFQAAIDLYAGDLLPADPYEEWIETRRASLRTSYLTALARMARLHEERDNPTGAIAGWQRVLQSDPASEEAHVQLMLLLARAGRKRDALAQYDLLLQALHDELGVEPDPIARELADAIRDDQIHTTTITSPDFARQVTRSGIPAPATALIGRERELAEVQQALAEARLVTITGPGGGGKTRLAVELARCAGESFPDGVHLVPLASLRDATMLATVTIEAIGVTETGSRTPDEVLSDYFLARSALLVFDNFEHVVDAAHLVSTLLETCPALKVLTTSRVPLHLRGEREFSLRALTDQASARLFIERSTAVQPAFDTADSQLSAIVAICRKLDGLPLAIELAAARSRVLSPAALLERLDHPLALLTGGSRDLPDRQKTLRATITWSYDLLGPEDQALFRALAVYSAGWTMEATEAVSPAGIDPLDGVTTLVASNLLEQQQLHGEPRFRMLETIREFGLEQLALAGETEDIRLRHAEYVLTLAERLAPSLRGPTGSETYIALSAEHENLRTALTFMLDHDPGRALRIIASLEKYWATRGSFSEWEYWIDAALSRVTDGQPDDRTRALNQLAFIHYYGGRPEQSRTVARESLEIAWEFNLRERMGQSTSILGFVEAWVGDEGRAMQLAEEALGYYRESGNTNSIATQLMNIAMQVLQMGDYERGREMMQEALILQRNQGDTYSIAVTLANLGEALREMDLVREAAECLDEGLDLARTNGASQIVTEALVQRSMVATDDGQTHTARELLSEGISNAQAVKQGDCLPFVLEACAALLTVEQDMVDASQMFAAADTARTVLNLPRRSRHQEWCERYMARCRAGMEADAWNSAQRSGQALPPDAALARVSDHLTTS